MIWQFDNLQSFDMQRTHIVVNIITITYINKVKLVCVKYTVNCISWQMDVFK